MGAISPELRWEGRGASNSYTLCMSPIIGAAAYGNLFPSRFLARVGYTPGMSNTRQLDLLNRPSGRTSIIMASGFVLDLTNPNADGLPVEDIARALAFQPRWCGATSHFYSVAEHSVMVSRLVPAGFAYHGLWHDCIEAISGDWPTPLKTYLGRDGLRRKLAPIEAELERRFNFRGHLPEVKKADLIAMATELRDLLPPAWMDWGHLPPPHEEIIRPVGPEAAFHLFMERHEMLKHMAQPSGRRRASSPS